MRASEVVAIAVVAAALLAAFGAHAWIGSPVSSDPAPARVPQPPVAMSAPENPTPRVEPRMVPSAQQPRSQPELHKQTPPRLAEVVPPAPAEAPPPEDSRSEASYRTQRFLHSRRDDGQHAE